MKDRAETLPGHEPAPSRLVAEYERVTRAELTRLGLDRQLNLNEAILRTKILRPDQH